MTNRRDALTAATFNGQRRNGIDRSDSTTLRATGWPAGRCD